MESFGVIVFGVIDNVIFRLLVVLFLMNKEIMVVFFGIVVFVVGNCLIDRFLRFVL